MLTLPGTHPIEEKVIALTSFITHKYYCENDVESIISLLDRDVVWLGTAEHEYAAGLETVAGIFRRFAGQVPKCDISGEEYSTLSLGPDACLCAGRLWIATAPSTGISLRVHQRITTAFRQTEQGLRCCHIHVSNPYEEMVDDDVGFPVKLARQSYQYLQEQIEAQKRQIAAQTATLQRSGLPHRRRRVCCNGQRAGSGRLPCRRGGGPGRDGGVQHQLLGGRVLAGGGLLPQGTAGGS